MSDTARIKPSLGPITNARLSIPLVIGINAGPNSLPAVAQADLHGYDTLTSDKDLRQGQR